MTTSQAIRAVIFDVGRVLVNVDVSRGIFRFFTSQYQGAGDDIVQQLMHDELIVHYNCGRLPPALFHQAVCRKYGLTMTYAEFFDHWCAVFAPIPGIEALLARLHPSLKIGCLSDTDPMHWSCVEAQYPFIRRIKYKTLSFRAGLRKPDPRIFQAAVTSVGLPPAECLYVDDLEDNVVGASAAGLRAVRFESVDQLENVFQDYGLLQPAMQNSMNH
jgi:glucose-1-phosphatase